tara:strand:+ start:6960 stop:7619 length:660 start_codon:yes stop_codon:yes gene_type:complete
VNNHSIYLLSIFTVLPILGCQKPIEKSLDLDNISYINEFELIQENSSKNTRIKITSPKATIDPTNNDIQIFDSSIEIINLNGQDIKVRSGKSTLNNYNNFIKVYNKVNISLLDKKKSFITTNSFDWDLNTSNIILNSPLNINLEDTNIISASGFYNFDSGQLKINNNIFNRKIFNKKGKPIYQIRIVSDTAKWIKNNNSFEFISADKQVETTIDFLSTK